MMLKFKQTLLKAMPSLGMAVFMVAATISFTGLVMADPIRVSEAEAKAAAFGKVAPALPPIAKQAHITGRVVVDLTVGEDGTVEKVDVVSGNPILAASASKAGKGWMFTPFKCPDGKASKALVRLSFEF